MFKKIPDYTRYSITRDGAYLHDSKTGKTRELLKLKAGSTGYRTTKVENDNGHTYKMKVHRLVALAYIENALNKPYVNHLDGDKLHNVYCNLEWTTAKENTEHAITEGLTRPKGTDNGNCIHSTRLVKRVHIMRAEGCTYKHIAAELKVSFSWVDKVVNGRLRV